MRYQREGTHSIAGLEPLIYVKHDPKRDEDVEEKLYIDDVEVIEVFYLVAN